MTLEEQIAETAYEAYVDWYQRWTKPDRTKLTSPNLGETIANEVVGLLRQGPTCHRSEKGWTIPLNDGPPGTYAVVLLEEGE